MLEIWTRVYLNVILRTNFACLESSGVCGLQGDLLAMLSLILTIEGMHKMPLGSLMVKMVGELSFLTTQKVAEVVVVVVAVVGVVVVLDLIRNAMSVASLAILPVSAGCKEVLEGVGVVALLGIAGAQVMVEGVTVLVVALLDVAACLPGVLASAGLLIMDEMRCHMPTEMVSGKGAGAGAGVELGLVNSTYMSMQENIHCVLSAWT